ncbi:MAG: thermosome subunit beta [Halobacteriales archaeon]
MSQQMGGQPMIIMGEDAQRVRDRDAQEYNIRAARAVADAVRSTLGPKGMDKMLVSSFGSVTITNDGVTILDEMDIENPTAEMIVEVAQTQEDEVGDGTTTAVAIAGELLKKAEDLLEQDIHPSAVIRGFALAQEEAASILDDIAVDVDPEDVESLREVAATSMTGKGTEVNKDLLAELAVDAVRQVTVQADTGEYVVDMDYVNIETQEGQPQGASELVRGLAMDKDPVHDGMPSEVEDATILLTDQPIEVDTGEGDATISLDDPSQLQQFLDQEEAEIKGLVDNIVEAGANVVFCQKGIDDLAQHYLAKEGILAVRRAKKSDITFLANALEARIVSNLDTIDPDDLGHGSVRRDEDDELFYIESDAEESHGVTLVLRGSTEHVVDELERGIEDALDVVSQTIADGRVLAGGGAAEVELASRLRDYADSVSGREQLAVEAFADAVELVPRVLAENAGLDPIDTLVDLRSAHEGGEARAGLDVFTGEVVDNVERGVIEPLTAKYQALTSASEAANLVLKIDDIIAAGDLGEDDEPGAGGGMPDI